MRLFHAHYGDLSGAANIGNFLEQLWNWRTQRDRLCHLRSRWR